jgi:hypothetical protein
MTEKLSGKTEMSELVFASEMMRDRIAPVGRAPSKGERIAAAARSLKWKPSRAKAVWYAEDYVSIKHRELRKIEELSGVTYTDYTSAARTELRSVEVLIDQIDALTVGPNEAFYRPFVDAFRSMARAFNRPGASEQTVNQPTNIARQ